MPKRLLSIERDSNGVYLVIPLPMCRYALLSYCWGGDQCTKTTKQNLASYEQGINVGTLPRTIRDAIEVTNKIVLKYL